MKGPTVASRKPSYYIAGAIRGDTSYLKCQILIRAVVGRYGEAYTERSERYSPLDPYLIKGEPIKEKEISERDMNGLRESRAVIAEVSGPSTGTGAEVMIAIHLWKPTLCLYHHSSLPSLIITQYTDTHKHLITQEYSGEQDLVAYLACFMELVDKSDDMSEIRRIYMSLCRKGPQSNLQTAAIRQLAQQFIGTRFD